ncbi:MAG: DUF4034 domain-containing protein [Phycisphaerales bacterium]|nr:DUF4034 domain-containing protein [Phycisphaerales bacterium]
MLKLLKRKPKPGMGSAGMENRAPSAPPHAATAHVTTAHAATAHSAKPAELPPAVLDPIFGDADALRLRGELESGRFDAVEAFMSTVTHPDDRTFYAQVLSEWPGKPAWVDAWLSQSPQSATANLICGMHGVYWAWEARGYGYGNSVGEEARQLFSDRLLTADVILERAAELDPSDPTPWALMLRCAYGLGLDEPEHRRRFTQAVKLAPEHRFAHSSLMQSLCAKWYGSHDLMFRFVSNATSQAGPGSPVHTLVAEAHLERWLSMLDEDEAQARAYWTRPVVRSAITHAAHLYFDAPTFHANKDTVRTRNIFAWTLVAVEAIDAAARQFEAIGPHVTRTPWVYMGDPIERFEKARTWTLEHPSRNAE